MNNGESVHFVSSDKRDIPFFSICIPQYNRTSHLLYACAALARQTFKNFEVCISDDNSTDGRHQEIIDYLHNSGLAFVYMRQKTNVRYDANLRASIGLARGTYCLLHGNDDCLASTTTLYDIHESMMRFELLGAVITNYQDWSTKKIWRRVRSQSILGAGPDIAARYFRDVAFVSGIIVDRVDAQTCETERWDGSEMYQMYLFAQIVSGGKNILGSDLIAIKKDIKIQGEIVDSYATKKELKMHVMSEVQLPLMRIGRLVAETLKPYVRGAHECKINELIFTQLYLFTYPFWLIEYRYVQSWMYAFGVCLGMRPKNTLAGIILKRCGRMRLASLFWIASMVGLVMPRRIFRALYSVIYLWAKTAFSLNHKRAAHQCE